MRDDDYPAQAADPELSGLPDTADDDSNAYDEVATGRWADGADPAALPGVGPGGMTRFGTTAAQARAGEGLDRRLRQEEPDTRPDDPSAYPGELGDEAIDEQASARLDADVFGESPVSDPESAISMYDDGQLADVAGRPVGRLVDLDDGAAVDTEAESVAYDAGAAGGGPTAEELAMHETREPHYR
ncbi:MAG TPA: DUF5709 domain-containing protein [Actinoplanes sp.]|nr:DUF5709 domain-containing protein [Actinoplanes sp.]